MLVCLYSLPLVVTVRPVGEPIGDADVWWHLRAGQWIVENHRVPTTDPFSQHGADKPWVDYSWLFEVGLYGLYAGFGLFGVVVYRALLSVAVTAAVHRLVARREPRFLPSILLTAVALIPLSMLFNERPWLFSILFFALTLDAVLDLRAGRRNLVIPLLPIIFIVWANVHIQFVYGLVLLAVGCVAPAIDRRLRLRPSGAAAAATKNIGRLVALTALCAAATLLNPYLFDLYQVVWDYATQPGPFDLINEFKSLEFREVYGWVVLGLAAAAVYTLGRRRGASSFDFLLLGVAALASFRARRDLWCVVVASLAVLTSRMPSPAEAARRFALTALRLGIVAAATAFVAVTIAWQRDLTAAKLRESADRAFPARAADFVLEKGIDGPVFNHLDWGGYLIWRWPSLPVAIDGRTNLHGDERLERFQRTWLGEPGWRDDPDLAAAGLVIGRPGQPLTGLLRTDPRFRTAYEDEQAVVFVRRR
jgi:hypothetical protein